jgi:hypothetical protein
MAVVTSVLYNARQAWDIVFLYTNVAAFMPRTDRTSHKFALITQYPPRYCMHHIMKSRCFKQKTAPFTSLESYTPSQPDTLWGVARCHATKTAQNMFACSSRALRAWRPNDHGLLCPLSHAPSKPVRDPHTFTRVERGFHDGSCWVRRHVSAQMNQYHVVAINAAASCVRLILQCAESVTEARLNVRTRPCYLSHALPGCG